jgi:cell division septation protein DedD
MRRAAIVLMWCPLALSAQAARGGQARVMDSLVAKAQRLVKQGDDAGGRALIDSLLASATVGSPAHREYLFWHGALAASDYAAERDFKQLVAQYPISARAADALLRLGDIQAQRGNRDAARQYLERVPLEFPGSAAESGAWLSLSRLSAHDGDAIRECRELRSALRALRSGDVELKTRVEFSAQRCLNVPDSEPRDSVAAQGQRSASDSTQARSGAVVKAKPDSSGTAATRGAGRGNDAAPSSGRGPVSGAAAKTAPAFSVQVAAYSTKSAASSLAQKLTARGYASRVVSAGSSYRVWVGRYPSRSAAQKIAQELKDKKITTGAFVVEATDK